MKIEKKV